MLETAFNIVPVLICVGSVLFLAAIWRARRVGGALTDLLVGTDWKSLSDCQTTGYPRWEIRIILEVFYEAGQLDVRVSSKAHNNWASIGFMVEYLEDELLLDFEITDLSVQRDAVLALFEKEAFTYKTAHLFEYRITKLSNAVVNGRKNSR